MLPDGTDITYTMVEHPGYAMVVPLLDDGRVVLERVYRYTVQETLLECPSGGVDPGDATPEHTARRELEEETGFLAGQLTELGAFYGRTASATSTSISTWPPACARAARCDASRPSRWRSSCIRSSTPWSSRSRAASRTRRALWP